MSVGTYKPNQNISSLPDSNWNIDEIRIDKPRIPILPVCVHQSKNHENLVLSIPTGGMEKCQAMIDFVREIQNSFAEDILRQSKSKIENASFMFIYDADSRGIQKTMEKFKTRFTDELSLPKKGKRGQADISSAHRPGKSTGKIEKMLAKVNVVICLKFQQDRYPNDFVSFMDF